MRVHFGIKYGESIVWPKHCQWCGGILEKWQAYDQRSIYGLQFRFFYWNIFSRKGSVHYPLCNKHNLVASFLRPSRLFWVLIICGFSLIESVRTVMAGAASINTATLWVLISLSATLGSVAGFIYYYRHGLVIHDIGEQYIDISLPVGEYADQFRLINDLNSQEDHCLPSK